MSDTDFSRILKNAITQKLPGNTITSDILHEALLRAIVENENVETVDAIKETLQTIMHGQPPIFYEMLAKIGIEALEEHRKIAIAPMFM